MEQMCFTPFALTKVSNLLEINCGPLSVTNCSGKPNWAKICPQFLNRFLSCRSHRHDFQPFGMSVDDDHEETSLKWAGEVHMNALPRSNWPGPRVQQHGRRFVADALAWSTGTNELLNLLVDAWPPDMDASKRFHPDDAQVTQMQFIQDSRLVLFRDNHMHSP